MATYALLQHGVPVVESDDLNEFVDQIVAMQPNPYDEGYELQTATKVIPLADFYHFMLAMRIPGEDVQAN